MMDKPASIGRSAESATKRRVRADSPAPAQRRPHSRQPAHAKAAALAAYASSNSSVVAAQATGVPPSTIRGWASTLEGRRQVEALRREWGFSVSARIRQGVERATDLILRQLEHGESRVTRSGDVVQAPPAMRDVAVTLGILTDKERQLS